MKYFAISDTHFSHNNIIKYCNRPFKHIDEMNEKLIENWNENVTINDIVFHLGDFAFEKDLDKLSNLRFRLNGKIILIKGNHDLLSKEDYLKVGFNEVYDIYECNLHNVNWTFCHYQMSSWNHSHRGSFHLFGHEHWKQQIIPNHKFYSENFRSERKFNVCVDCNNFKPVDILAIKNILEKRSINEFKN